MKNDINWKWVTHYIQHYFGSNDQVLKVFYTHPLTRSKGTAFQTWVYNDHNQSIVDFLQDQGVEEKIIYGIINKIGTLMHHGNVLRAAMRARGEG